MARPRPEERKEEEKKKKEIFPSYSWEIGENDY